MSEENIVEFRRATDEEQRAALEAALPAFIEKLREQERAQAEPGPEVPAGDSRRHLGAALAHATQARQELQHATAAVERARLASEARPRTPAEVVWWSELTVIGCLLETLVSSAGEMERRLGAAQPPAGDGPAAPDGSALGKRRSLGPVDGRASTEELGR